MFIYGGSRSLKVVVSLESKFVIMLIIVVLKTESWLLALRLLIVVIAN